MGNWKKDQSRYRVRPVGTCGRANVRAEVAIRSTDPPAAGHMCVQLGSVSGIGIRFRNNPGWIADRQASMAISIYA